MYTVMIVALAVSVGVVIGYGAQRAKRLVLEFPFRKEPQVIENPVAVNASTSGGSFQPPLDLFEQIRRGSSALD